jgi:uncharacterized membrane protein YbhN (UPF0104 family)
MDVMFKRTTWRPFAAAAILVITVALFINFFAGHPAVRHRLGQTPAGTLAVLLGLYLIFTGSLAMVNSASLRLCRKSISAGESLLLTMYSAVINFFGPLQSGPAFRAIYLKKKHDVRIRDYTRASFVYYFFYALFSGLLLFSTILKWWLVPITVLIFAGLHYFKNNPPDRLKGFEQLSLGSWYYMATATLLQVGLLVAIFAIEVHAVAPGTSFNQVLVYTGAANLALFVSFTPGAIGFREAFLLFTQRLHHIGNGTIIAANTIDRGVYISMLLLLTVFLFFNHTKKRLAS